ncbi:PEP-CTERM protein-sorting domain-containing protein [Nitrosospira sp. Nl5]|uniref:FxDxF family PEP-CTERM protein n=1 Tax=Nitrosospira sp. Nl5 TaxID=200120 RepID=UPI0008874766|nr:FxDxF family PEP-CTERM protein [Nitrosospira sp. Nl5]SCY76549.1 PEP-CTERM protein-sorting domain-containing protein [Nitrosospira sp. Nl5]
MINFSLKRAVAIAMLAGASAGVHAHTGEHTLGNVAVDVPTSFNNALSAPGAFNDIFSFTLPATASSGYTVQNFPLTIPDGGSFNTMLTSLSLVSNPDGVLFNQDDTVLRTVANSDGSESINLAWGQPLQGDAYLSIAGIANGTEGGLYHGAIAAIPEPETYAMLLAGLGLMGAVVRRRSSRKTS